MEDAQVKTKVTRKELKERIKELETEVKQFKDNDWKIAYYEKQTIECRCRIKELEAYIRGLQGKNFHEDKEK